MAKKAKVPLNVLVAAGTRTVVKHLADVLECSQGEVVDRAMVLLAANEDIAKGLAGATIPNGAFRSTGSTGLAIAPLEYAQQFPDPREIPGVSVGMPEKKEPAGFPCRCVHTGCRGGKFTGMSRTANLCDPCRESGHTGDPRNCSACADDSGTGAL